MTADEGKRSHTGLLLAALALVLTAALLLIAGIPWVSCPHCAESAADHPEIPLAKMSKYCDLCRGTVKTTPFQSWKYRRNPPTRW